MVDIGLGARYQQMKNDEQQHRVTVERLRLLSSRARKVYRARDDLAYIF